MNLLEQGQQGMVKGQKLLRTTKDRSCGEPWFFNVLNIHGTLKSNHLMKTC